MRWMMFLSEAQKKRLYADGLAESIGGAGPVHAREPFRGVLERLDAFDAVNGDMSSMRRASSPLLPACSRKDGSHGTKARAARPVAAT